VKQHVICTGDAATRLLCFGCLDVLRRHAEFFQLATRFQLGVVQRPVVVACAERVRLQRSWKLDIAQPVAVADLTYGVAVARSRTQNAADQQPAVVGHVVGHRVDTVQDAALQLADGFGAERQGADDHEVQQDAQRPDVHVRPVVTVVAEQFGRSVRRRATERGQSLFSAASRAEAEVAELDLLAACEVDVLCLQVAVHHVLLVLQKTLSPVFENTYFTFFQISKKHDFLRFLK